ncbi:hypothetical protein BCV69DRAFT_301531 [Microstroma glucosiphilum]|uniref:Protein transport protein SEC31 n=1 Tax=Pseudomicrostroma glucosiphilum TaxID=1684307 RepID=A0A316TZI5_9BASI|nr:hypothetical protein BCV69DRAFT_301531 [Pseudomicrostroma glucosiphilum]PWN18074.1 hypothetical protein BCV69DRAFT_301531 [Pseudomicrostroma glucosiphilum]
MKASIPRTANFSWSPASLQVAEPYIATGTAAGALDESFSNESVIEIWQPKYRGGNNDEEIKPLGSVATSAKLNRLAWGYVHPSYPKGLLAAGLENGELGVWDAQKIIDGSSDSQILRNTTHTGPVRGLDFNLNQTNLLASGAVNGEIYIWDLTNPTKPYSPGARSTKLDEITALSWNAQVPHILATSSSSGYTVVWDLKNKREVCALAYGGGAGTAAGGPGGVANGALAAGARRGMGAVAWHPDISTRLATASEDDSSPIIMLWDLRMVRAPEKIMTGHDKGVLSLSWCKHDSDLLLSCGKDNRTIAWNPQTCEVVGELPPSSNWSFDVQWCPRNPELLATASFDGRVGIHSMQATNQADESGAAAAAPAPAADGSDIFNLPPTVETASQGLTLKQPPKWLRRPVAASFGFGGQLVSVPKQTPGAGSSRSVNLRNVVTEPAIVTRATRLQEAIESQTLAQFCDERSKEAVNSKPEEVANWKALQTLFQADSRDELVSLLGFNKEDVAAKVANAISAYKRGGPSSLSGLSSTPGTPSAKPASADPVTSTLSELGEPATPHEPVVSFAEQTSVSTAEGSGLEATPSEISTLSSDNKGTTEGGESEATEPSLFSEDAGANGSSATDQAGLEFFNTISGESGAGVRSAVPERVLVPHMTFPPASSVAATAGSPGPSSVASADLRPTTFRIYPSDESDADKLITRALVLGDFESAVSLCVSTDRFADALLLAVRGGPDLLARTQKTYFERRTTSLPYLRLFQSIVSDDLTDVVQNADLNEWQEIFVVLCTFAKAEDFSNLAEQLGQRLEFQYVKTSGQAGAGADSTKLTKAKQHRKNAILCYLAAGKLEKVAGMWIDEMKEEEAAIAAARKAAGAADGSKANGTSTEHAASSLYSAHAEALQTFIEKITVFQNAVGYVDADLQQPTTSEAVAASGARTYKLAALYDRIHEYVELLADQGLLTPALKYVNQTPSDYAAPSASSDTTSSSAAVGLHPARERLLQADSARSGGKGAAQAAAAPATQAYAQPSVSAPAPVQQQQQQQLYSSSSSTAAPSYGQMYDPYAAANPGAISNQINPYSVPAPQQQQQQPVQQVQRQQSYGGYAPPVSQYSSGYEAPTQAPPLQRQPSMVPAPPPMLDSTPTPYGMPSHQQQAPEMAAPPPPPPKRADGGWNDIPDLPSAANRRAASAMGQKAAPIMSPFPNSPVPTPGPYGQQSPAAPPPRGGTPGARSFASPPPPQGSGFQQQQQRGPPPPRPPPQGPSRSASGAGMRPQQGAGVPPVPSVPQIPALGGGPGPYAPPPGQQQQQQARPSGPYAPPPGQQGGPPQQLSQGPPGPPGMPFGPPGQVRPPPGSVAPLNRSQTPGAGAGPPRSHTPAGARPGAPQFKYPPGDRAHIPEAQRGIFATLSRELSRVKATAPPAQKRVVDDSERRLNSLFDYLNNGMIPEKVLGGLQELVRAIEARNQQAALQLHVQVASSASGEVAAMLVGVKFLITRLTA